MREIALLVQCVQRLHRTSCRSDFSSNLNVGQSSNKLEVKKEPPKSDKLENEEEEEEEASTGLFGLPNPFAGLQKRVKSFMSSIPLIGR